jgi:hypothetical protein
MRGFFEPVDKLLDLVELYCSRRETDCELLLFESYWVKGSTQLQLNQFASGLHSFQQAYNLLQRAVEKGFISPDDDRIAIACGLMGNGCMAMNKFNDAESWYLRAFHMWEKMDADIFKDKELFVSLEFSAGYEVNRLCRPPIWRIASPTRVNYRKRKRLSCIHSEIERTRVPSSESRGCCIPCDEY